MRKYLVLAALVLAAVLLPSPAPGEAQGREYPCLAPCHILNIYTDEEGRMCITSFCECTQQTTTDCRDPE